ncbi:MAG: LytTR family DNA-binding domain-containing protein [Pseudomonadales bacterium]|nr:LytTR family DNA-binding domain-containing protein [Pseudomonadales bacterium]|tara:strand:+ start:192 stop:995 length:804 start_codon:yes stop_codon:yes gene_type:complete
MDHLILRVVVIDDEAIARQGIITRLKDLNNVEVVAECGNAEQAMDAVSLHKPDLLLVDINMPKISGIELVARLQGKEQPMVIFVTAFDRFAVEAFELHAVDYLLKPVSTERLIQALDLVRERLLLKGAEVETARLQRVVHELTESALANNMPEQNAGHGRYNEILSIKDRAVITRVPVKTIEWVDAAGDYMCIHASGVTHILRMTMKNLEALLDPLIFQRIHRSTLVNISLVHKVRSHVNGEYQLELFSGTVLKMSRTYRRKVQLFV